MIKRTLKNIFFITLLSVLLVLCILELIFRYFIPAAEMPNYIFDFQTKLVRFDTEVNREGVYTIGPLARERSSWLVNNFGWNSSIDYKICKERGIPLISIIGDSYVEALQVDTERNLMKQLHHTAGNKYAVYGFGIAAAPLSQYLKISRYVNRIFCPDLLVFINISPL